MRIPPRGQENSPIWHRPRSAAIEKFWFPLNRREEGKGLEGTQHLLSALANLSRSQGPFPPPQITRQPLPQKFALLRFTVTQACHWHVMGGRAWPGLLVGGPAPPPTQEIGLPPPPTTSARKILTFFKFFSTDFFSKPGGGVAPSPPPTGFRGLPSSLRVWLAVERMLATHPKGRNPSNNKPPLFSSLDPSASKTIRFLTPFPNYC